jgi:hypothetical protein
VANLGGEALANLGPKSMVRFMNSVTPKRKYPNARESRSYRKDPIIEVLIRNYLEVGFSPILSSWRR